MTTELKPEPVPTFVKCSVCELPWADHEALHPGGQHVDEVSLRDCIKLLKAELAKRPSQRTYGSPSPFDGLLAGTGMSGPAEFSGAQG
jgi:hypothetical protein